MKFREPMGAHSFEEKRITFPCAAQPKMDGVRCVTDGRHFWSRNGKRFPDKNIAHLKTKIAFRHLVDGELMIPNAPFEETISALKHASNDDRTASLKLRFHVFDVMTDAVYRTRQHQVVEIVRDAKERGARWDRVRTMFLTNRRALDGFARVMIRKGFEGTMIRNMNGLYVSGKSYDLLKWKPLQDAEFKIVEVREAKGKDSGTPIFVCKAGKHLFRVRPMGSIAIRQDMWRKRARMIGRKITVEYQNMTKHGVPRFPRAKVLRDYE